MKIDYTWLKGTWRNLAHLQSKNWSIRLSALEWNKVTWYSKLAAAILFIILPIAGFYLGIFYQRKITLPIEFQEINQVQDQIKKEQEQKSQDQQEQEQEQKNQDTKEEQVNKTETDKNLKQDNKTQQYTFDSFSRDCGKSTLIVYVFRQISSVAEDDAKDYFIKNNLKIVGGSGSEFIIQPPNGLRNFWGQKIEDDKMGDATIDSIGCDFAN